MVNIDEKLIAKELEKDIENGFLYTHRSLSNRLLDKLFNKYYVIEACQNFYDSEPDIEDYISDIAFMYNHCTEEDIERTDKEYFTKDYIFKKYNKEYSKEEGKQASEFVCNERKKYYLSDKRIQFCNWQEPYFKGNWGMSQNYVDKLSKKVLKSFKKISVSKNNRVYFANKDNEVRIYLYGRDIICEDWWFIFKKRS